MCVQGWRQEAQEEELHHPQEDQAQAPQGQAGRPQVLQGRVGKNPGFFFKKTSPVGFFF